MKTLYYLIVERNRLDAMLSCLVSHGLNTDVIGDYYKNHLINNNDMIMWCDGCEYPSFVFNAQRDIIVECGERIYY